MVIKIVPKLPFIIGFVLFYVTYGVGTIFAHNPAFVPIKGKVITINGEPINYATVFLVHTSYACFSDAEGNFLLMAPPGEYELQVNMMGYESVKQKIEITSDFSSKLKIQLKENNVALEDVNVVGQTVVQQINKTAYNVSAIDAKQLHNNPLSVAQILDRVSGVKIKQTGGVGSGIDISLNGFSGNHVRVFMDGIPLDGSGSSMQLGKIPIDMADHIEVYKGGVPVDSLKWLVFNVISD